MNKEEELNKGGIKQKTQKYWLKKRTITEEIKKASHANFLVKRSDALC